MDKVTLSQNEDNRVNIKDVIISETTKTLYDYSNRENEINALKESIAEIGQKQPISVIRKNKMYIIIDGVLRYLAMLRLNSDKIKVFITDFTETNEFSLTDLIIHHQIRKEKTAAEKHNEVKSLLRINSLDKNPLRDKEKRVSLISFLLGSKGWGRNNVFNLERILLWEQKNGAELGISLKVISNELAVNRALEALGIIEDPLFDREKERESGILEGFLKGKYNAEQAVTLIGKFDTKKADSHTLVKLYPKKKENFTILQGDIEKIQLPEDLEIDTIFTSPPYYHIVRYGDDPNELGWEKTPEEYINRLADILMKCFARLKNTGAMFVNLGETYEDGQCLGITEGLVYELKKRGVRYLDRVIWNKTATKPSGNNVKRLLSGHETILYFSKSKDYYFEKFKIQSNKSLRVSRGCKEKGSDKRNYHIPNKYDQFRNVLDENEVSTILTVQVHRNRTKHVDGEEFHPATFTSNLPVIPLLISTPKKRSSVVFDPFLGFGSCGVAALLLGFKFVGVELYEKNIKTAERILSESQEEFNEDELNSLLRDIESRDDSEDLPELNQAA